MRSVTHLLFIEVGHDDEEAEGHPVPFALGEQQPVGVAAVSDVLQKVSVPQ